VSPRGLALAIAMVAVAAARAQGGPPLVTDDPDTPGDGHWEINLAAIANDAPGARQIAVPDADINYGWGDRVQLKLELPWLFERDAGRTWTTGLGGADVGVKWRFLDRRDAAVSVSTYPQYTRSLLASSTRRGLVAPGWQFFLPVEAATQIGSVGLDAEIGRLFDEDGISQWEGGVIAGHACTGQAQCLLEIHETASAHQRQTLLNFGLHWQMLDALALLAAAGRQFGSGTAEPSATLIYLGIQFNRYWRASTT
jgi:hypothetical protein